WILKWMEKLREIRKILWMSCITGRPLRASLKSAWRRHYLVVLLGNNGGEKAANFTTYKNFPRRPTCKRRQTNPSRASEHLQRLGITLDLRRAARRGGIDQRYFPPVRIVPYRTRRICKAARPERSLWSRSPHRSRRTYTSLWRRA